jgi:hypothetical protein
MNNSAGQQQRGQVAMHEFDFGDYIVNATANDAQHQPSLDIYADFPQQHRTHSQMNLDPSISAQNALLASQNLPDHLSNGQPQSIISAEMLNLKGRLEQQMKLQQLQQLILQQQVCLCSSHCFSFFSSDACPD